MGEPSEAGFPAGITKAVLVFFVFIPALAGCVPSSDTEGVRRVLFDGRTLVGWHSAGDGEWSVVDGAIRGLNPEMHWNHLVTDDAGFGDFTATLKWRHVTGNTGIYLRAIEGGRFKMTGLQIELGSGRDGSVMWVSEDDYGFEPGSLSEDASGVIDPDGWNTLEFEVGDGWYKTMINGKTIIDNSAVTKMINARGSLALQMHAGENNEVYFKDIEVSAIP